MPIATLTTLNRTHAVFPVISSFCTLAPRAFWVLAMVRSSQAAAPPDPNWLNDCLLSVAHRALGSCVEA